MAWRIRRTSMKSQRHSEGNDVKFEYGRPVGARYSIISLSSYELFVRLCGQWCGSSCTASVSRDARVTRVGGIRFAATDVTEWSGLYSDLRSLPSLARFLHVLTARYRSCGSSFGLPQD